MAARKVRQREEIVVFAVIQDAKCEECGAEVLSGELIKLEDKKALCMDCADLGHLDFLPRGDMALTRRAGKYSRLKVVVVQWSRSRKRYERQGILAEPEAILRAEAECLSDEDARRARREREARRREEEDAGYVAGFARRVRELYPGCPPGEEDKIARHAARKYSGRVGRSAAAKRFDPGAIDLAVLAHVRHAHTNYEFLLSTGWQRHDARSQIRSEIQSILSQWRAK